MDIYPSQKPQHPFFRHQNFRHYLRLQVAVISSCKSSSELQDHYIIYKPLSLVQCIKKKISLIIHNLKPANVPTFSLSTEEENTALPQDRSHTIFTKVLDSWLWPSEFERSAGLCTALVEHLARKFFTKSSVRTRFELVLAGHRDQRNQEPGRTGPRSSVRPVPVLRSSVGLNFGNTTRGPTLAR